MKDLYIKNNCLGLYCKGDCKRKIKWQKWFKTFKRPEKENSPSLEHKPFTYKPNSTVDQILKYASKSERRLIFRKNIRAHRGGKFIIYNSKTFRNLSKECRQCYGLAKICSCQEVKRRNRLKIMQEESNHLRDIQFLIQ